ncbi:sigma-70 family RNA polymerase sigma factor [Hyphomonas sp. WL0036]|nr:sigma-70 family RNA polymerase sigma factor [Hyphomonas sediminis]
MADMEDDHSGASGNCRELSLSEELLAETYDLLRRIASRQLTRQPASSTLNTTMIVHEAWLKLSNDKDRLFVDQDHYLATASRAMRQLLVDHARRKLADKRGGGAIHLNMDDHQIPAEVSSEAQILDIEDALAKLAKLSPELERVVECRFFAGLTVEETANALGSSVRTVERRWAVARAFLADMLRPPPDTTSSGANLP